MKTKHRNAAKFKRDRRNIDHNDALGWIMRRTMPLTTDEILRDSREALKLMKEYYESKKRK